MLYSDLDLLFHVAPEHHPAPAKACSSAVVNDMTTVNIETIEAASSVLATEQVKVAAAVKVAPGHTEPMKKTIESGVNTRDECLQCLNPKSRKAHTCSKAKPKKREDKLPNSALSAVANDRISSVEDDTEDIFTHEIADCDPNYEGELDESVGWDPCNVLADHGDTMNVRHQDGTLCHSIPCHLVREKNSASSTNDKAPKKQKIINTGVNRVNSITGIDMYG